jgi:hypothetical protein
MGREKYRLYRKGVWGEDMIFRLDGGIENLLALTPVLVEWRRRNGPPIYVETLYPDVFRGNPYVDKATRQVRVHDFFFDLNLIPWHKLIKLVTESYAEKVLGDTNLSSWKTIMSHTRVEDAEAKKMIEGRKMAAVSFGDEMMEGGKAREIEELLVMRGYVPIDVSSGRQKSLGVQRAIISNSAIFVGSDGEEATIAFTTDVPSVVCYSYRDPCYFMPFRRGVPFSVILPSEIDCDMLRICLAQNSFSEYGKIYQHVCPKSEPFACRRIDFRSKAESAIERILATA